MTIGMSSAAFYGEGETEDQAARLADFPLDVCEVFLQTPSEYAADFGALVRRRLGALPCVSAHPKGTQFEQELFGRSPRQVADALRVFRSVCEAARALGAKYVVFHGPFSVAGPVRVDRIHALTERWALLTETAQSFGLTPLWENVSWCALRAPEDARTLRALLPDIGFVLDVKQAYRAGTDPFAMAEAMGEGLRHVHALDRDAAGGLCLPGEGVTDWPALLGGLRAAGYDGAVILEPYAWMTRDPAAVRRSLDVLRHAAG